MPTESILQGHDVADFYNFDDFDDFVLQEITLLFKTVSLSVAAQWEQEGTDAEIALTAVLGSEADNIFNWLITQLISNLI